MTAEEELAGIVARMQAAAAAADDGAVVAVADAALPLRCSFCVKDRGACKRLISGPGNIYICDECVELCSDICGQPEDEATQAELLALRARVTELEAERDRMLPIYTAHLAETPMADAVKRGDDAG